MFPEGHRAESGELQQAKGGIGLLGRLSGVPVVPVSISGTLGFLRKETWKREIFRAILRRRPPIVVVIHKPLCLKSTGREDDEAIATEIMVQIASGLREEDRGFYREKVIEGGKTV
jgi:1-acyl-sn-glycerol-3-phosphate acyltransferase